MPSERPSVARRRHRGRMDMDERPTRVDLPAPLSASAVSDQAVATKGERAKSRAWFTGAATTAVRRRDTRVPARDAGRDPSGFSNRSTRPPVAFTVSRAAISKVPVPERVAR